MSVATNGSVICHDIKTEVVASNCLVDVAKFEDKQRKAVRAAARKAMADLGCFPSRAKAMEHAKQHPSEPVVYDPKEFSFGSLLLAIVVYRQQASPASAPSKPRPVPAKVKSEAELAEGRRSSIDDERAPNATRPARGGSRAGAGAVNQGRARDQVRAAVPLSKEELFKPPARLQQLLQYPAMHPKLISYLKDKGVYNTHGKVHWGVIRNWLRTDQGVAALREAGLDPLGVHLDHIIPDAIGGLSCVFNCCFMPSSANSHFGKYYSVEKCAYLGRQVCAHAEAFAQWHSARSSSNLTSYSPTGVYVAPA